MKIVVIGGTGLIGTKVVSKLTAQGHQAVAASPKTGVNTLTGEGLASVLSGAQVIVDVSNSPSFEEKAVMDFFRTSTTNLLRYGAEAGVKHFVALSVVGTDKLSESAYFRAKIAQEKLILESGMLYSIVRATQFFEFVGAIAASALRGNQYRLPSAPIRPIASDDVAREVSAVAVGAPLNGTVDIAGPEEFGLDQLARISLRAAGDEREVVTDPQALYFDANPEKRKLVPEGDARFGATRFEEWLPRPAMAAV